MADRNIADPEVEDYAAAHSSPEPSHLAAVADATREASGSHRMMVGRLEGRFIKLLVAISGAKRVLEIGTFSGYSALCIAEALPGDGRVITLELDPEHAAWAQANFDASEFGDRIELRVGPALESLRSLKGPFDLVFIDADKPNYRSYYERVVPKLAPHGVIVADNTLWSGRVTSPASKDDLSTRELQEFNDHVVNDPRVECVVLTIRDGVTVIRRRE